VQREDFAQFMNDKGILGLAVEVGIAEGSFAKHNLGIWKGKQYSLVDPWKRYPGWTDLLERDNTLLETQYQIVVDFCKNYPAANILRMMSTEAALQFADNSIDWVYLDANHDYAFISQDIQTWYPKVRSGGVLSGHDYRPWYGVFDAVNEFIKETGLELNLTDEDDWKSWWIWKP
jgi:hypothetical protein